MQHLDEGTIHAWIDGALGTAPARAAEEHAAACNECASRVAEARGLIAASSRILTALDHVPAGVVPAGPAHVGSQPGQGAALPARRSRWGHRYGRLAAVLAFVIAGTLVVTRETDRHAASVGQPGAPAPVRGRAMLDSTVRAAPTAPSARPPARASAPPRAPAHPNGAARAPAAALGGAARGAPPAESRRRDAIAAESAGQGRVRAFENAPKASDAGTAGAANAVVPSVTVQSQSSAPAAAKRLRELEGVTVSALGAGRPAPRLVAIDSVQRGPVAIRRETYEVAAGERVVLETTPPAIMPNDSVAPAPAPAASPDSAAAAGDSARPVIRVIRWRGADGTAYALSGPVSADELQRIRTALGKGP